MDILVLVDVLDDDDDGGFCKRFNCE